jgi:hypothetical protein
VIPALAVSLWLWRPDRVDATLILVYAGLTALLPLHNGAGRYADWAQHYQVSRVFAGLPAVLSPADLGHWTPLFHELNGAVLAWASPFWMFQMSALFLGVLWLWPARILLGAFGFDTLRIRLLAVGLNPLVVAMVVYPWPWAACAFFVLAAVVGTRTNSRWGAALMGLASAGAVLTHEGSLGYVIGLLVWIVWRARQRLVGALASMAAASLPQLLWLFSVGTATLAAGAIPIKYASGWQTWLLTRPLMWTGSILPIAPSVPTGYALNELAALLIFSLPAALLATVVVARRYLRMPSAVACMVAGGMALNTLAYPSNQWRSGMYEGFFFAVLLLVALAAARAPWRQARTLIIVHAMLAAAVAAGLLVLAWTATSADRNVGLKGRESLVFLVDRFGWLPGALALSSGVVLLTSQLFTKG